MPKIKCEIEFASIAEAAEFFNGATGKPLENGGQPVTADKNVSKTPEKSVSEPEVAQKTPKNPPAKSKVDFGPAPKKAEKEEPKDEEGPSEGDVLAAIQTAIERMQKKGVKSQGKEIEKIIRAYLPEEQDTPPYSHDRVPPHSWGDLISDFDKLGR